MRLKLKSNQVKQFKSSGVIKITDFFTKNEIVTLKGNLLKKLKKKNSFDRYYENLNGKKYLRRIEKFLNS